MVLHASFLVCCGFMTACLLYSMVYSFIRERTPDVNFDHAADRVRRITKEFLELQQAQGKEREALGRQVAALIREECQRLLSFIDHACSAEPPQDGEIRELLRAAHAKGLGVYWKAIGLLF